MKNKLDTSDRPPGEQAFYMLVQKYRGIGYGRMIQIVQQEWQRDKPETCPYSDEEIVPRGHIVSLV